VDGQNLGALRSYTFSNVNANHQISASFVYVPSEYAINASSDKYTVIYPSGVRMYTEGSDKTYLTQAKPGSDLLNIIVDDESNPSNQTWNFTNITRDHNISTIGQYTPGQVHVMFGINSTVGMAPLCVEFVDQSAGLPTSWYWQFGDGTNSTIQNPAHLYYVPGIYSVTLRAINNQSGGVGVWNDAVLVTSPIS
jgi:PKD repeat protein